jgi:hypothetical protein
MLVSQAYLSPLADGAAYLLPLAGGAVVVVAALRYLTLFIGLVLALHRAPETDRLPIYREFARALGPRPRRGRPDAEEPRLESPRMD